MPRQYEAIRDKFIGEGMGTAEAKTRAAKIYNSKRGKKPALSANAEAAEKATRRKK